MLVNVNTAMVVPSNYDSSISVRVNWPPSSNSSVKIVAKLNFPERSSKPEKTSFKPERGREVRQDEGTTDRRDSDNLLLDLGEDQYFTVWFIVFYCMC